MIRLAFSKYRSGRRWIWVAAAVLLLMGSPVSTRNAPAQGTQGGADAITPVEDFARQVEQLKKSYPELAKKFEDGVKSIDDLSDVNKARKEIEEIRGAVAEMLGAVSDNGTVARLGNKATTHARTKLRTLEQDARFKPEERQFLLDQWRRLLVETERASEDLDNARKEFTELLRTLQTREDFIDELMQIRRATDAINVIRQLTRDIREASEKLKTLIGGIRAPGA